MNCIRSKHLSALYEPKSRCTVHHSCRSGIHNELAHERSSKSECTTTTHPRRRQCGMCIAEYCLLSDTGEIELQYSMQLRCCTIVTRH